VTSGDLSFDRPATLSADLATRDWAARSSRPEMVCAGAWSEACRVWWHDGEDDRLRRAVLGTLHLGRTELDAWKATSLDERGLLRAHAHVTAMRAALERDGSKRKLVTGALRDGPVVSYHRTGRILVFPPASELRAAVAEMATCLAALPSHPFLRAAWISDVIGGLHPFVDGNGGTARFLASLELARAWLPPIVLSSVQRNGAYIDSIVGHDLPRIEHWIYETMQRELANALLSGSGPPITSDAASDRRAERWVAEVDRAWRTTVGVPVDVDEPGPDGIARLVRRGYRMPRTPAPRCVRWSLRDPLPVQLELVITSVGAGGTTWQIAMLGASVARDGALGAMLLSEWVPGVFIAAASEDDVEVSARFGPWLALRVSQCSRGLAAWM
jgi:hypothetical protein